MSSGKPARSNLILTAIIAPVLVALIVGGSSPWWWAAITGADTEGSDFAAPAVTVAPAGSTAATDPAPTRTTAAPATEVAGCYVTISNGLVDLSEQPEQFSQSITRLDPGDYPVLDWTVTSFGGLVDERWLKTSAGGHEGWIKDDTWTVAAKSASCDFA